MNLSKKLELVLMGYLFTIGNIIMTIQGYPLVGVAFGLISVRFFIKALLVKPDDN